MQGSEFLKVDDRNTYLLYHVYHGSLIHIHTNNFLFLDRKKRLASNLWPNFSPFFFFPILGLELRAYTLRHSTSPFFVMGFFDIGSGELFAQAGFKP
jgi:hypothetical protein